MKKIFILIITLILVVTLLASCQENRTSSINLNNIKLDVEFDVFDIALNDNNVYIADKNKIQIYDIDGQNITGNIDESFIFCEKLHAAKEKLYAYDSAGNTLYLIDYKTKKVTAKYDCPAELKVTKFVISNDDMVIHDAAKGKISIYNLTNKTLKECDVSNIKAMCLFDKNNIMLIQSADNMVDMNFLKFDYLSGKFEILDNIDIYGIMDVEYLHQTNSLILMDSEKVYEYQLSDSSNMILTDIINQSNIISQSTFNKKFAVDDKILVNIYNSNTMDVNALSELKKSITINVITTEKDWSLPNQWIVNELRGKYGRINLKINVINRAEYKSKLLLKFMASDNDFDLFELKKAKDYQYIQKKTYENLAKYESINNSFNELIPEIKSLCSYDNEILGVPYSIGYTVWEVNTDLKDKLGISIPEKWNWDDFYKLAKEIKALSAKSGFQEVYIMRSYDNMFRGYALYEGYETKYLDLVKGIIQYDTDEIKYLTEIWKKLYNEKLILNEGTLFDPYKENILLKQGEYYGFGECDNLIIPPGENNAAYIGLYSINKQSKNKDVCVDFLTTFLSSEARKKYNVSLLPFYKSYSVYEEYKNASNITEEGYEFYVSNFKNVRSKQDISALYEGKNSAAISVDFTALFEKYFNGEISVDELLKIENDHLQMLVKE